MKRIIFVDDEANVLSGLRRMLRSYRREWEMVFVESAEEALQEMGREAFDVIISDMRMPVMDGVELLSRVMKVYPDTIRIALSGHADMEVVLECVGATHQYLAKPCDADTVKATIDRAFALQSVVGCDNLKTLVTGLNTLPSLPTLYTEVIEAIRDGRSIQQVGEIVGRDVAMTAKILQIVNSAYFGLSRHVETPGQAVSMLGLDTVRSLVLSSKVFKGFESGDAGLDIASLWDHSARVGSLAQKIAIAEGHSGKLKDFALMAGMLHDVGRLVIAANLPQEQRRIHSLQSDDGQSAAAAEYQVIGHSHQEIGAYLLGLWGLPNPLIEAVAFHHNPSASPATSFSALTAVHIADALLADPSEQAKEQTTPPVDEDYLAALGLIERLPAWLEISRKLTETEEAA